MTVKLDLVNQKFGKLLVLKMTKKPEKIGSYVYCLCECGNHTTANAYSVKNGRTKSCGCGVNQSHILKFKKENPDASESEIIKQRIKAHTKWVGECLEWTATLSNGYGTFVLNRKTMNASRAAWIASNGEIPKGLCVCHYCDNRRCCRTSHMFLGTHKSNTYDMIRKGRDNWQTQRKFPIGTTEKVGQLRESGKKYIEIAHELELTMDQVKSQLNNYKRKLKLKS